MITRDRDANGQSGDGLEERLYAQHDANFNVTAIINSSGTVVERMVSDPYGTPTFLNGSWGTVSGSAYAWVYVHQSGRWQVESSQFNFRNRDLRPTIGRWDQMDPIRFRAGDLNLYRYESGRPLSQLDPSGLKVFLRCFNVYRGFGIFVGVHCGVIVYCNGKAWRFDGSGPDTVGNDPAHPDRPVPTDWGGEQTEPIPMRPGLNEFDYEVNSPWKDCENEVKCLVNAYNRILQLPCSIWRAVNSNTYAHALLRVCSMSFKCFLREVRPGLTIASHQGGAYCPRDWSRYVSICSPPNAVGWDSPGYGSTVVGGPKPDWK